jgi:hypothetical protein
MIIFFNDRDFLNYRNGPTKALYFKIVLINFFVPLDFEVVVALGLDDFTIVKSGAEVFFGASGVLAETFDYGEKPSFANFSLLKKFNHFLCVDRFLKVNRYYLC